MTSSLADDVTSHMEHITTEKPVGFSKQHCFWPQLFVITYCGTMPPFMWRLLQSLLGWPWQHSRTFTPCPSMQYMHHLPWQWPSSSFSPDWCHTHPHYLCHRYLVPSLFPAQPRNTAYAPWLASSLTTKSTPESFQILTILLISLWIIKNYFDRIQYSLCSPQRQKQRSETWKEDRGPEKMCQKLQVFRFLSKTLAFHMIRPGFSSQLCSLFQLSAGVDPGLKATVWLR